MAERFQGFPEGGMQFFLELQAEQSRTWFKAHQDDFVRLWRQPLEAFVADLQTRLADTYPGLSEVTPHYFRIQRDTRFARDKTPYKTYVAADLPIRPAAEGVDPHAMPGLYVSFGLEGEYVAFGAWHMSPEVLGRYRAGARPPQARRRGAVDRRRPAGRGLDPRVHGELEARSATLPAGPSARRIAQAQRAGRGHCAEGRPAQFTAAAGLGRGAAPKRGAARALDRSPRELARLRPCRWASE